jgi:hypothetical protein
VNSEKVSVTENDYYNYKYSPVPGGCEILTTSSLATPTWDKDHNENAWLTAAHVVNPEEGKTVYQNTRFTSNAKIGESDKVTSTGNGEYATILNDGTGVQLNIAGDDGGDDYAWDIYGSRSDDRLKDMAYYDEYAYRQGSKTGRKTGIVMAVHQTTNGTVVDLDTPSDDGDSGGPYFDLENGEAYIMGVHAKGGDLDGDGEDEARGNTIETIEDDFNLYI